MTRKRATDPCDCHAVHPGAALDRRGFLRLSLGGALGDGPCFDDGFKLDQVARFPPARATMAPQ